MRAADGKIMFGEWLPDQPELDNPGLTDIVNAIPEEGGYTPFLDFTGQTYSDALASRPIGAFMGFDITGVGGRVFAATASALQYKSSAATTWNDVTPAGWASTEYVRFSQYGNGVIAVTIDEVPQYVEMNLLPVDFADLATTGTAPRARQVGVVGQFVFLGDTLDGLSGEGSNHVQWSGIDNPRDWSTPGTAGAIAVQAGEQFLPTELGAVTGIVGGDQFGVIFQQYGATRATYEGGETVFAFDKIENGKGCYFPNSIVEDGGLWYYISTEGFHATNGVQCIDIGEGKVNKFFVASVNYSLADRVYGAIDRRKKLIYWTFVRSGQSTPDRIIVYNIATKRFSKANMTAYALFTGYRGLGASAGAALGLSLHGFNSSFQAANFLGQIAGSATFTTAEIEAHPGLYTMLQGVKPLVSSFSNGIDNGTTTVAVGTRDTLVGAVSWSSETAVTARTGFADFRSEARYHRARLTFGSAWATADATVKAASMGLELQAIPTGAV